MSIVVSGLLGRLALSVTPFGHMVTEMRRDASAAGREKIERRYGDLLEATTQMLRLTTFILDPIAAVITGIFAGLWGGKRSARLAALGILPLAMFSALSYSWLGGMAGGAIDILAASGAARLVSAYGVGRRENRLSPGR